MQFLKSGHFLTKTHKYTNTQIHTPVFSLVVYFLCNCLKPTDSKGFNDSIQIHNQIHNPFFFDQIHNKYTTPLLVVYF